MFDEPFAHGRSLVHAVDPRFRLVAAFVCAVCLTVVMLLWNYLITPIYMEMDRAVVAAMLPTVFLPFNLVKGGLNMAVILLLYKPVVTALRRARLVPESQTIVQPGGKVNAGFLLFSLALLATFVTLTLVLMGIL